MTKKTIEELSKEGNLNQLSKIKTREISM